MRLIYIADNPGYIKWGYIPRWVKSVLAWHATSNLDTNFESKTDIPSENPKFFYSLLIFTILISEGFD
jgi:hypothetical protein